MRTTVQPNGTIIVETDAAVDTEHWDGLSTEQVVVKAVAESRFTLSMGYPADSPDIAKSRDGHLDFASAESVEKAAWNYLRSGAAVGLFHEDGTEGAGEIVESYIYRGPDWDVDGQVIKAGDWLIGTIWDQPAWDAIQRGDINGTSMQGRAKRGKPSPADVARVKARRG